MGHGDPKGFLETYAPEKTYFDRVTEHWMDGFATMTDYYLTITGKIEAARYEMIRPKVQRHSDVVVLTYNLRSEAVQPDGKEVTIRWNSTAGYAGIGREWNTPQSLVSDHPSLCEGGNVIVAKIFWRDRSEHDKPLSGLLRPLPYPNADRIVAL